jgi:hypothetical protein
MPLGSVLLGGSLRENSSFSWMSFLGAGHREYYDSENGQGYGMNPFWGWSSLAYVMPLEYQLQYDPTKLEGKVRPIITEKLGIRFPENTVINPRSCARHSFRCEAPDCLIVQAREQAGNMIVCSIVVMQHIRVFGKVGLE